MVQNYAISGKICSGKSTSAKYMKELIPNAVVLSFAGPIKELAVEYFAMVDKDRELLVWLGETFRNRDPNVWIKKLLKDTKELNEQGFSVIVDDLRMPLEFDALRDAGFVTIRLNVSETVQEERIKKLYPETFENHFAKKNSVTECGLDLDATDIEWDYFFAHDLSVEMVERSLETVMIQK